MRGKEHYDKAEQIIAELERLGQEQGPVPTAAVMAALAKAQVHATLAAAYATAPELFLRA